jgi:tetratricopeptide (TPR) repeat protein
VRHYESDELLAYLDHNDGVVDLAAVQAHVAKCAECTERLRQVSDDYDILSDPQTWMSVQPTGPAPPRLSEYWGLRERLARDTARAESLFAQLSERPPESWIEHLTLSPDECTSALARRIILAARSEEERAPRTALDLLLVAETLLPLIRNRAEVPDALADLWKERANTLMVLGDYTAALAACDRAAEIYAQRPVAAFDLAFTDWSRASIYFEMGRYADALPFAERAEATLRQFGDTAHATQVRVLVACVQYEQGNIDGAERLFTRLLAALAAHDDRLTQARVLANIACCRLMQEDTVGADAFAGRAIELYEEFGLTTEIMRTRWAMAIANLRRGKRSEAMAALEKVALSFRDEGLIVDAAEVELDIVAELVRTGEYERAAAIAGRLATIFVGAEARVSTARALEYLREASLAMIATPDLIRAVRHVLAHPEQPFEVPAPPDRNTSVPS